MATQPIRHLVPILGDQLSQTISSLDEFHKDQDIIVMMEVMSEATYVKHHPHKIILIFAAMRHFAQSLLEKGFKVEYLTLDDKANKQSFDDNLKAWCKHYRPEKVIVTEPGEYRVKTMIDGWHELCDVDVEIREDTRFFASLDDFRDWARDRKELRLEYFYRELRQRTGILMEDKSPIGGKYNYDVENRKPPKDGMDFEPRLTFEPDEITVLVIELVREKFKGHMGECEGFEFAVTRKDALRALHHFIKHHLPHFGDYQDAMILDEYYLNHSVLSMYLNIGLLLPDEVCHKAEQAFLDGDVSLNNCEGFIRQILGWREFVRGLYWYQMPEYRSLNYLNAKNRLPAFYWHGDTTMTCLRHAINQTLKTATSHHIQRLMITGNFAMLLGVVPDEICEWYLAAYADAFEWVELPNTLGMSQFADGGIMASKPYCASGNYINKMSNFCSNCEFNVKEKLTDKACPFNDLYWGFLVDNQNKLKDNPRLKFAYNHVNKMSEDQQKQYKQKRKQLIKEFCGE